MRSQTENNLIIPDKKFTDVVFFRDIDGSTAVEFAISGALLILFTFVIINLGDLGLVFSAMRHGVQGAVRVAAIQTGVNISQPNGVCTTSTQLVQYFNNVTTPLLPAAGTASVFGHPIIQYAWTNATSGTFITITVNYNWIPIGLPYKNGIPLSVSATQMVGGTTGTTTRC